MIRRLSLAWIAILLLSAWAPSDAVTLEFETAVSIHDGLANLKEGQRLLALQDYDRAAMHFWRAVLLHASASGTYTVEESFQPFLQCFALQGRTADGFVYIAQQSFARGQDQMGKMYLQQALGVDPNHAEALLLRQQWEMMEESTSDIVSSQDQGRREDDHENLDGLDGTPEEMYERASKYFVDRNYEQCADVFEASCIISKHRLGPSCANAVYCRNMILDWGFNGTQFDLDMKRITQISKMETAQYRAEREDGSFYWRRSTSVHPHMMLGYPVDSMLKRYVTESAASMDEMAARVNVQGGGIKPLPDDLPFDPNDSRAGFLSDSADPGFRIRVGFVASGFNSKAVLYLCKLQLYKVSDVVV
jgi:tetratricopeptide (TPR) repeat protein